MSLSVVTKTLVPPLLASLMLHGAVYTCANLDPLKSGGISSRQSAIINVDLPGPAALSPPEVAEPATLPGLRPGPEPVASAAKEPQSEQLSRIVSPTMNCNSSQPAKVVAGVSSAPSGAGDAEGKNVTALAAAFSAGMHMQYMMQQMQQFHKMTRMHLQSLLAARVTPGDPARARNAGCLVTLKYPASDSPLLSEIACDSEELADQLSTGIAWNTIPHPQNYSLPYRSMEMTLRFGIVETRIGLKPLE